MAVAPPSEETGQLVAFEEDGEPDGAFDLPFRVATLQQLGLRCYFLDGCSPQWPWYRVHHQIGIGVDVWVFLKRNEVSIKHHLQALRIAPTEFVYNSGRKLLPGRKWKDHTFESRALIGMLLWVLQNRPLKAKTKQRALKLMLAVLRQSVIHVASPQMRFHVLAVDPYGALFMAPLCLDARGVVTGWDYVLDRLPGAGLLWMKLKAELWCDYCISTSPERASFSDIWYFLAWLVAHRQVRMGRQNLYLSLASVMLADLLPGDLLSRPGGLTKWPGGLS